MNDTEFEVLYKKYKPKFNTYLRKYYPVQDIDDYMQECFIVLLETLEIKDRYKQLGFNSLLWMRIKQHFYNINKAKKAQKRNIVFVEYKEDVEY
jgi:DNA-directed RNA polymerase specialized sigma24 family protein